MNTLSTVLARDTEQAETRIRVMLGDDAEGRLEELRAQSRDSLRPYLALLQETIEEACR